MGAIAGWIASVLTGNTEKSGCATNIVRGMIGSLIGGFLVTFLVNGKADLTGAFTKFNLMSLIVSTIGAVVFLGIVNIFKK